MTPDPQRPTVGATRRWGPWIVAVAVLGWCLDRLTKMWAVDNLPYGEPRELIGSLVHLTLVANPGAAFSLATGSTWIFTIISTVVVIVIALNVRRIRHAGWAVALGLLLGGSLGNLTDRLIRPPGFGVGHVVDFIEFPNFPIFNVADICIVSSAILIGLLALRGIGLDGTREGEVGDADETLDADSATAADSATVGDGAIVGDGLDTVDGTRPAPGAVRDTDGPAEPGSTTGSARA